MRPYTDQFPQTDQQILEQELDAILSSKHGLVLATEIVKLFLDYYKFDNPVYVALYADIVNSYLYKPCDPTPRQGINGKDLLLFLMRRAFPQFVAEEVTR
jgi:hypothetical protein